MLTSKNLFDLNGKIALVAGSSRGIGFALANALKENGAYVIGLSREPNKKKFLSEHYICDVTKKSNIEDILTKLIRNKIKIDIVIFAAGISIIAYKETSQSPLFLYPGIEKQFLLISDSLIYNF